MSRATACDFFRHKLSDFWKCISDETTGATGGRLPYCEVERHVAYHLISPNSIMKIMQGTTPGSRSRGRPKTAWMLNITSWTGLSVEQLLRAVEDRYQWRLTAHEPSCSRRWLKTRQNLLAHASLRKLTRPQ